MTQIVALMLVVVTAPFAGTLIGGKMWLLNRWRKAVLELGAALIL